MSNNTETKKIGYEEVAEIVKPFIKTTDSAVEFDEKAASEAAFAALGTTEKELNNAYKTVTTYTNGVRLAIGEAAIDVLAKNKDIEELRNTMKVAGEKVTLTTRRQWVDRNVKTGEEIVSHGGTRVKRVVTGSKTTNNDIRDHLAKIGASKLV